VVSSIGQLLYHLESAPRVFRKGWEGPKTWLEDFKEENIYKHVKTIKRFFLENLKDDFFKYGDIPSHVKEN
jgi:hypothetical protein